MVSEGRFAEFYNGIKRLDADSGLALALHNVVLVQFAFSRIRTRYVISSRRSKSGCESKAH
jgi:hypothetical protein